MKKVSTTAVREAKNFSEQKLTIGLDLGDRSSWYCVLDEAGVILLEQRLSTTPKAMRIFQRQQVGECDQRAHPLDLLQQRHLRIAFLHQAFDPFVALADAFAQRLDSRQQRLQCRCSSGLSPSAFSGFIFRTLQPRSRSP